MEFICQTNSRTVVKFKLKVNARQNNVWLKMQHSFHLRTDGGWAKAKASPVFFVLFLSFEDDVVTRSLDIRRPLS